jgi:hypothetical protein
MKASSVELASVTCARPERNATHLFFRRWCRVSAIEYGYKGREWGRDWDVLLSWCSVEARVEAGRYDGVAHVGDCAKLEDTRAGSTRL